MDTTLPQRAHGMMQALAGAYGSGTDLGRGPDRELITEKAAIDAVMQIFAAIDEPLQAGDFPPDRGLHIMMLLVGIHEFIKPIPGPPGDEALFETDLGQLAALLREHSP